MINTWFKFEVKIQKDSKVITFTKNHTDDDADNDNDGTKNNKSPPVGGGSNITTITLRQNLGYYSDNKVGGAIA